MARHTTQEPLARVVMPCGESVISPIRRIIRAYLQGDRLVALSVSVNSMSVNMIDILFYVSETEHRTRQHPFIQ